MGRSPVAEVFCGQQLLEAFSFGSGGALNECRFQRVVGGGGEWCAENVGDFIGYLWWEGGDDVKISGSLGGDAGKVELAFHLREPNCRVGVPKLRDLDRDMCDARRRSSVGARHTGKIFARSRPGHQFVVPRQEGNGTTARVAGEKKTEFNGRDHVSRAMAIGRFRRPLAGTTSAPPFSVLEEQVVAVVRGNDQETFLGGGGVERKVGGRLTSGTGGV